MIDDPFKDLRSKVSLARAFPDLALRSKEARAQAAIDAFAETWQPLFSYLQAVAAQDDFKPMGKVIKAKIKYKEDTHSRNMYLIIAFCDEDQDADFSVDPHLSFYCGLIEGADNATSQNIYTDFNESVLVNVPSEERSQAVYHMLKVMTADNFADNTENIMFVPQDFEPCRAFLNKWLATQIATDLGQNQSRAGTSRQFRFD